MHYLNISDKCSNPDLVINLDLENGTILKSKQKSKRLPNKKNNKMRSILKFKNLNWNNDDRHKLVEALLSYQNNHNHDLNLGSGKFTTGTRNNNPKFQVKLMKKSIFDLNIDLGKSSTKRLNEMGKTLNSEYYLKTIKNLKFVAFERKSQFLMQHDSLDMISSIQNSKSRKFPESEERLKSALPILQNDANTEKKPQK